MAASPPLTYKNHRKFVPLYHFVLLSILLINVVRSLWILYKFQTLGAAFGVLVALAILGTALYARLFALGAQDRVIALEMRLRLQEALPNELRARSGELRQRQLIGLRFASDAELPILVGRVLNGELKGSEEIKKAIQTWKPDPVRI